MANCSRCGKKFGMLESGYGGLCAQCHYLNTIETGSPVIQQQHQERVERDLAIEAVMLTTETQAQDLQIQERISIVTAECAYGMHVFKDLFATVRNIVGGRSEAVQKTMRDARETVLYELKREAHAVGANAVVGVDLDYTQIGETGWTMVMLVASGTAVRIEE